MKTVFFQNAYVFSCAYAKNSATSAWLINCVRRSNWASNYEYTTTTNL